MGIKIDYQGVTFILASFGSRVLALAVLEAYFRAERSPRAAAK